MSARQLHARTHAVSTHRCITQFWMPEGSRPTWCRPSPRCGIPDPRPEFAGTGALPDRAGEEDLQMGAALMTETSVKATVISSAVSNLLGNTPLERALQDNLERLGPPPFDDADKATAAKFQATLSEEDIERGRTAALGWPTVPGQSMRRGDRSAGCAEGTRMVGSTDVGDVGAGWCRWWRSWWAYVIGTPGHSWQLTAHSGSCPRRTKDWCTWLKGHGGGRSRLPRSRTIRYGRARKLT